MSNKHNEDLILSGSVEDIKVEEVAKETRGVVIGCLKLNIREEPNKDSKVVVIAACFDELMLDLTASTDDWYAVCTASGIEGFCMKQFVDAAW